MEEIEKDEQGTDFEEANSWLKDNLRIIISIIIVVVIAGGVYSYSKRTQNSAVKESDTQIAEEQANSEEAATKVEIKEGQETATQQKQDQVAPAATSQETDGSFIETAGLGDGKTHLARRALANYLEKNPDSALTAEHKIYIEDYLRKNSGTKGSVHVGTSVEFSKDLINKAIDSSKQLSDKQLQNLHQYALRVPSLS